VEGDKRILFTNFCKNLWTIKDLMSKSKNVSMLTKKREYVHEALFLLFV